MTLHQGLYGRTTLIPFPDHFFSGLEDRRAALAFLACDDAVAYMTEIKASKGDCAPLVQMVHHWCDIRWCSALFQ